MAKDWKIELIRAHTRLFRPPKGYLEGAQGYPECNEGWRDLIDRACVRIENALDNGDPVKIVQIKEKYGTLRFYWSGRLPSETEAKVREVVSLAEARSACTCEICGAEGRLYGQRDWLATRCAEHAAGDHVPPRYGLGFENIRRLRRWRGQADVYFARYDRESDTLIEVPPPEWER